MHNHYDDHHHDHDHDHNHEPEHGHGHSHGLIDESIIRSKEGVRAVSLSLVVLLITALLQLAIFAVTNSLSLFADLIHNFGDALTALPLGAAFLLKNKVAEKYAGYFVVLTIFVSACVSAFEAIARLMHPQAVTSLIALVGAGLIGFLGNEIAAFIRLRAGRHLHSPALIADGNHARIDGLVSISVIVSAIFVAFGHQIADPIIGLIVTIVILRITWHSYETIRNS